MWNCGAWKPWPATRPTPIATWTKIASSTIVTNHHRARTRNGAHLWAPSAHRPARALPKMTTQAQLSCRSRSMKGTEPAVDRRGSAGRSRGHHALRVFVRLGRGVDQIGDLV